MTRITGAFGLAPHSANVEMWLEVNGQRINVSKVGNTFIVTREPVDLQPCDATLTILVDGHEDITALRLPHGMSRNEKRAAAFPLDGIPF